MNLRMKLLVLFGATVALPPLVTTEILMHQATEGLTAEIMESTEAAVALAAHSVEDCEAAGGADLDEECLRRELRESLSASPYISRAELVWPEGGRALEVQVSLRPGHQALPPPGEGTLADTITRRTSLSLRGEPVTLVAHADGSVLLGLRQRLMKVFALIIALAMITSLALLYWGAETLITRPMMRLRRRVQEIADGRLERQDSPLPARSDEIGVLASALDDLVVALSGARAENAQLLENERASVRLLDERVALATRQLRATTLELEQALDALLETREQLSRQERLAALGQLAGTIAHELGTPLSNLSGQLELLTLGPLADEDREAVVAARHEAQRMTEIIRRVLSNTRGLKVSVAPVDLRDLLAQSVELVLRPDDRERLEVRLEVEEDARRAVLDPGLVTQVLINLISNARDAIDGSGTVLVAARRDGARLIIEVGDSGPGIPPPARARIFDPFFTTKPPERGTGLGLAICNEITRTLGGELSVGDGPLGGALLILILPAGGPHPPWSPE